MQFSISAIFVLLHNSSLYMQTRSHKACILDVWILLKVCCSISELFQPCAVSYIDGVCQYILNFGLIDSASFLIHQIISDAGSSDHPVEKKKNARDRRLEKWGRGWGGWLNKFAQGKNNEKSLRKSVQLTKKGIPRPQGREKEIKFLQYEHMPQGMHEGNLFKKIFKLSVISQTKSANWAKKTKFLRFCF